MPAEDFLYAATQIMESGITENPIVVITGGEPLMRNDLPDIGKKLRKLGYRWGIVTNGIGLTEEKLMQLVNAGMGAITLSIDGFDTVHNWIRQHPQAHAKAMEALERISKFERLESDVVTCVNKRNLYQLGELYNTLQATGLKSWRLFTITPIGRAINEPDFKLSPGELNHLMNFIQKKRQNKSAQMKVNFSCESYVGTYEGKIRDGLFFCRAGINIGSILVDGSISACPNIDHKLIQGSIYEQSFAEVWNNRFESFRNRSWTKIGACAQCKDHEYCQGNGLHWWDMSDKQLIQCHALQLKRAEG